MVNVQVNPNRVHVGISSKSSHVQIKSVVVQSDAERYTGEYVITPKVEEQTFPTQNKLMINDLTVLQVPFYKTSNEYGQTVYIASEV